MGFGDDDDSADPERVELVEDDVDDGRLGPLRGLDQGSLDGLEAVDGVRVAIEHLEQQVSSQSVQASGPPFDPSIYRTSPATFHSPRYYPPSRPTKFPLCIKTCSAVGSFSPLGNKKTLSRRPGRAWGVSRGAAESTKECRREHRRAPRSAAQSAARRRSEPIAAPIPSPRAFAIVRGAAK